MTPHDYSVIIIDARILLIKLEDAFRMENKKEYIELTEQFNQLAKTLSDYVKDKENGELQCISRESTG